MLKRKEGQTFLTDENEFRDKVYAIGRVIKDPVVPIMVFKSRTASHWIDFLLYGGYQISKRATYPNYTHDYNLKVIRIREDLAPWAIVCSLTRAGYKAAYKIHRPAKSLIKQGISYYVNEMLKQDREACILEYDVLKELLTAGFNITSFVAQELLKTQGILEKIKEFEYAKRVWLAKNETLSPEQYYTRVATELYDEISPVIENQHPLKDEFIFLC